MKSVITFTIGLLVLFFVLFENNLSLAFVAFAFALVENSLVLSGINYSNKNPIYGFITAKLIFALGLDHTYTTWWFLGLLVILAISLTGCTLTRQFPLLKNSKEYFFKKRKESY